MFPECRKWRSPSVGSAFPIGRYIASPVDKVPWIESLFTAAPPGTFKSTAYLRLVQHTGDPLLRITTLRERSASQLVPVFGVIAAHEADESRLIVSGKPAWIGLDPCPKFLM